MPKAAPDGPHPFLPLNYKFFRHFSLILPYDIRLRHIKKRLGPAAKRHGRGNQRQQNKLSACRIYACGLYAGGLREGHAAGDADSLPADIPAAVEAFSADSAFSYVKRQTDFGPRVPNTDAHRRAGDWIAATLRRHGAEPRRTAAPGPMKIRTLRSADSP